jgi:quercetin dioxygenase-like cupin family protein
MSKPSTVPPVLVPSGNARVLRAFGEEIIVHLDGEKTGGKLAQFTAVTPPGGGPPPHYHLNEDEWFHVLEGRVSYFIDGAWHEAGPGAEEFTKPGGPDMNRIVQISAEHGVHFA